MNNNYRHWIDINRDMFKACLSKDKESQKTLFTEAIHKNVSLKQTACVQAALFRG